MFLLLLSKSPFVVRTAPTSFFLFSCHYKEIMVSERSHSPSDRTFLTDELRPQVDVNLVHLVGCHRTFLVIEDEHNPCALGGASCESFLTFRIAHSEWLVKDCGDFHGVSFLVSTIIAFHFSISVLYLAMLPSRDLICLSTYS